jgi:hypothetical protein
MLEEGNGWVEGQIRASPLTPLKEEVRGEVSDLHILMPGGGVSVWYSFGCAGKSFESPDTHLTG